MSEFLKKVVIERLDGDTAVIEEDVTIQESRMSVFLNGEKAISMMCIPVDQDAHALGFLMGEGVISDVSDVDKIEISEDGLRVDIFTNKINEESLKHLYTEKTLVSGCGGGITGNVENAVEVDFIESDFTVEVDYIRSNVKQFYQESELYRLTGCVHKAMLILDDGLTICAEDIGRHNAIDKVVGKARLSGKCTSRAILVVSGRLSSEMVVKAVMHKLPIVVSRTAPTFLGVKTAMAHGITLIGFARGQKMNIYSHSARLSGFKRVGI